MYYFIHESVEKVSAVNGVGAHRIIIFVCKARDIMDIEGEAYESIAEVNKAATLRYRKKLATKNIYDRVCLCLLEQEC